MSETWGWDDITGEWLDVDIPPPADIPVPRDGSLTDGLAPSDVTGVDEP